MNKFKNKYRIESARKPKWDYRKDGAYFITICTKSREHFFGEIENGTMQLSGVGILAEVFWHEIINHTTNVKLGQFVVMLNHIHGILILDGDKINNVELVDSNTMLTFDGGAVETLHATSLPPQSTSLSPQSTSLSPQPLQFSQFPDDKNQFYSSISPKPKSVSTILRSYKSVVTKHVNRLDICNEFEWQERFHDHIFRDEPEFHRIVKYIENNPPKWNEDKFFS